jgi:hypothetical protein
VAFNSHALIAHTHTHRDEINNVEDKDNINDLNTPLLDDHNNDIEGNHKIYHDCINDLYEDNNNAEIYFKNNNNENGEIGNDEQIIRNIISSKGQFSSVLHSRNLSK